MSRKHLHELLKQDQEPFHLNNFISDHRRQLKSTGKTVAGAGKRKPITNSTNFCINHVCLFSFNDSPDFRKSPFLDFPANTSQNDAVFLHIPARTAAVLLDAATRVQNQPGCSKSGSAIGFGLFGSFLKRLKNRSTRMKRREIGAVNVTETSPPARRSRKSGADWSEKTPELETSCSSRSIHDSEKYDDVFASSPSSPFRFSLQRSPSLGLCKPGSVTPVASPNRHFREDKDGCEEETCDGVEEEEKEQNSPVSVLDAPFDCDEEEHDGGAMEADDYDIECSYASVQRAKLQLLEKLRRFERLAELDPIELEKHMFEQYDYDQEESTNKEIDDDLGVAERVCKELNLWKAVESKSIDMMVEMDFRSEGWKSDEETRETAMDVEVAIFRFLMEELAQELVN